VVRPYGEQGFVHIADTVKDFIAGCEAAMNVDAAAHQRRVDALLAQNSWDRTWAQMAHLIERVVNERVGAVAAARPTVVNQLKRVASAGAGLMAVD
jgi:hypothetical protein